MRARYTLRRYLPKQRQGERDLPRALRVGTGYQDGAGDRHAKRPLPYFVYIWDLSFPESEKMSIQTLQLTITSLLRYDREQASYS